MLAKIHCPTCQHRFSIPEGAMGERQTCPNCQTIFRAGKSEAESDGRQANRSSAGSANGVGSPSFRPGLDRTMLAESEPPIRYNCPRCKKPLEAPASEAGVKKPCPACGGRLQVPKAPPVPSADPNLNRTMLASDESNAAAYSAPAPVSPGMAPAPAYAAPAPAVSAPAAGLFPMTPTTKTYVTRGLIAAGVVLLILYGLGVKGAQAEQDRLMKAELDKLKADIEQKQALMDQQRQAEEASRRLWKEQMDKHEARQRELDREREQDLKNQAYLNDQRLAADAKARREEKERQLEAEKLRDQAARDARDAETKATLESLRKQLEAAKNKETTIITTPPPAPYYPWAHPRYYPWW